ncbi:MAG: hypothetical protein AAFN12_04330, partial [Cyanobacteria bacterium J06560_2]
MAIVNEQYLDIVTYNKNALNNLRRAVVLGQGQFSLILARTNYQRLQRVLIIELGVHLRLSKVAIPPDATNLRDVIESAESFDLASELVTDPAIEAGDSVHPRVLMLTGLASVFRLERLLKAANLGRDELPKRFPYPVVLWVNDSVLQQLNRYAPDLKSFSATPIRFEYPVPALISVLRSQAADTFSQILDVNQGIVLSNRLPLSARITEPLAARELSFAIQQLEHVPPTQANLVNNSVLADLLFLQGRSLHQQGELIRAKSYYEKSLVHWQLEAADHPIRLTKEESFSATHRLESRDKQAILRFHLGLWWRSQATLEKDSDPAYQKARSYFESCLTIFRQQNRSDRVARFILALADVLQKLEDWAALAQVASEGTHLHHNDPARLARDYGYLAEVSLARYQQEPLAEYLSKGQGFAQQALETSEQVLQQYSQEAITPEKQQLSSVDRENSLASRVALRYHRGCYFYLLAIAYQLQNQTNSAIEHLERVLQNVDPHYDLSLYRRSLSRLWKLYYDHKHYAEAFEIKLEQRRVETFFGLRAFIGASQIQLSPTPNAAKATSPETPYGAFYGASRRGAGSPLSVKGSTQSTVLTAAIQASGRTEDIEALVARLSQPRYTIVVMHGQSGVGKSSILRAGLVPRLRSLTSEGRTTLPLLVSKYTDWMRQVYGLLRSYDENLLDQDAAASEISSPETFPTTSPSDSTAQDRLEESSESPSESPSE